MLGDSEVDGFAFDAGVEEPNCQVVLRLVIDPTQAVWCRVPVVDQERRSGCGHGRGGFRT